MPLGPGGRESNARLFRRRGLAAQRLPARFRDRHLLLQGSDQAGEGRAGCAWRRIKWQLLEARRENLECLGDPCGLIVRGVEPVVQLVDERPVQDKAIDSVLVEEVVAAGLAVAQRGGDRHSGGAAHELPAFELGVDELERKPGPASAHGVHLSSLVLRARCRYHGRTPFSRSVRENRFIRKNRQDPSLRHVSRPGDLPSAVSWAILPRGKFWRDRGASPPHTRSWRVARVFATEAAPASAGPGRARVAPALERQRSGQHPRARARDCPESRGDRRGLRARHGPQYQRADSDRHRNRDLAQRRERAASPGGRGAGTRRQAAAAAAGSALSSRDSRRGDGVRPGQHSGHRDFRGQRPEKYGRGVSASRVSARRHQRRRPGRRSPIWPRFPNSSGLRSATRSTTPRPTPT